MKNLYEQWSEAFQRVQPMTLFDMDMMKKFTYVNPGYFFNMANMDDVLQMYRMMVDNTPNAKIFADLPNVKSDQPHFKSVEDMFLTQMGIFLELGYNNLDYLQKSFQIIQKGIKKQ